jgi:hypothetical protein
MIHVTEIRFTSLSVVLLASLICGGSQCRAEDASSVLASPAAYHGKRVTLTGVVRGGGPRFQLFADAADAREMTAQKAIYVMSDLGPEHWQHRGPFDLRRVRMVGVVNANSHGIWGNPCSLRLEKVTTLSGPVMPWPEVLAIFQNQSNKTLLLRFGSPPTETEFEVRPSDFIEVRAEDGIVRATSLQGSTVAKAKLSKRPSKPFYDSKNAASYYRIKDGKIESVLPDEATKWGWHR